MVTVNPGAINLCTLQGLTNQINLLITNWGLISAQQVNLYFGTHPDWSIQPLVTNLGDLAPQSSIVVPVTIIRLGTSTGVPDSITAQLSFSVTTPTQFYSDIVPIYVYDANPADCLPVAPTPAPVVTVCASCGVAVAAGAAGAGAGAVAPVVVAAVVAAVAVAPGQTYRRPITRSRRLKAPSFKSNYRLNRARSLPGMPSKRPWN